MATEEEQKALLEEIETLGNAIRAMKLAGAGKDEIMESVTKLKALKAAAGVVEGGRPSKKDKKEGKAAKQAPKAKAAEPLVPLTPEQEAAIKAVGDSIRELKAKGASKEEIDAAVVKLKALKQKAGIPEGGRPRKEKKPKGKEEAKAPAEKGASQAAESKDVTFCAKKLDDFPEWYNQILQVADIVDQRYPIKGMPIFTPYGFYCHSAIMSLLEKEWDLLDHQKAQFPLLIPEPFLVKEKDHVKGFESECFWVTKGGLNDLEVRLALRPTSETAMYHMFSIWVRSYNDLPLKLHQTCNVFRHETKDTRPLIRVREIYWNEAHTCHVTAEEALQNLEEAWISYGKVIHDQLGIFGLRLRRPEWDKFAGAEHTDVMDSVMPCGRVLQIVGAHYLGQKFAKVFDIKYLDDKNEFKHAWMTCYGVSTRLLACALAVHGDDKGLVLPPAIAQWQVVIVPIVMKKKDPRPFEVAKLVQQRLRAAGIRVRVDDTSKNPGEKYYYWEMKGVPVRIEIGPRDCDKDQVRLVRRDNNEKKDIAVADLETEVNAMLADLLAAITEKSKADHSKMVQDATTLQEVEAVVRSERGGFARIPFCSMGLDGKDAEEIVHEYGGGEVRGFLPDEEAPPAGTMCICHGDRPAVCYGYVARAY